MSSIAWALITYCIRKLERPIKNCSKEKLLHLLEQISWGALSIVLPMHSLEHHHRGKFLSSPLDAHQYDQLVVRATLMRYLHCVASAVSTWLRYSWWVCSFLRRCRNADPVGTLWAMTNQLVCGDLHFYLSASWLGLSIYMYNHALIADFLLVLAWSGMAVAYQISLVYNAHGSWWLLQGRDKNSKSLPVANGCCGRCYTCDPNIVGLIPITDFNCLVLWMRHKTEIPCTQVSMPRQATDPTRGGMCNLLWTPLLHLSVYAKASNRSHTGGNV
jgi:hypothetical protein